MFIKAYLTERSIFSMMSSTMISGVPAKRSERAKASEKIFMMEGTKQDTSTLVPEKEVSEYDEEHDSECDMIFDNNVEDEDGWTKVQYTNSPKSVRFHVTPEAQNMLANIIHQEDQSRNFLICQNSQAARTPEQVIKDKVKRKVGKTAKAAAKASAPYVKAGIDYVTKGALRLAATETAGNWLRKVKGAVDKAVDTVTVLQNHGNGER